MLRKKSTKFCILLNQDILNELHKLKSRNLIFKISDFVRDAIFSRFDLDAPFDFYIKNGKLLDGVFESYYAVAVDPVELKRLKKFLRDWPESQQTFYRYSILEKIENLKTKKSK